MKQRTSFWVLLLFSISTLMLAACGGSGGGGGGGGGNGGGGGSNGSPTDGLAIISVTPNAPSILEGGTQQFTATGIYYDSSQSDLTQTVTWSSSNESCVSVDANGLATHHAGTCFGTVTIYATLGSFQGFAFLQVSSSTVSYIEVTPLSGTVVAGYTLQLSATATYTDSHSSDVTSSVLWTSSDTGAATISNSPGSQGLLTGVAPSGAVTITAELDGIAGSSTFVVEQARPDLSVSISNVTGNGSQVTVDYTVSNLGTLDAGPFSVDLWADRDAPPALGEASTNQSSFTGLAKNTTVTDSMSFPFLQNKGTAYAAVDITNAISESDETNNVSEGFLWPSKVALFTNTTYVQYDPGNYNAEASLLEESMIRTGHAVKRFEGITASDINAAVAGKTVLAFPSLVASDYFPSFTTPSLNNDLDDAARSAIAAFVDSGGTLLLVADDLGRYRSLLNATFGYSIQEALTANSPHIYNATDAAGTIFDIGFPDLFGSLTGLVTSSLPPGAKSIYDSSDGCSVVTLIPYGNGSIIYLGNDWGWEGLNWDAVLHQALGVTKAAAPVTYDFSGGNVPDTIYSLGDKGWEPDAGTGRLSVGQIGDYQNSCFAINAAISNTIYFDRYGSSIKFYVDGVEQTRHSDSNLRDNVVYYVETGPHEYRWCSNDTTGSNWVDNITIVQDPWITGPTYFDFSDGLIPDKFEYSQSRPWSASTGELSILNAPKASGTCIFAAVRNTASLYFSMKQDGTSNSYQKGVFTIYVDGQELAHWEDPTPWHGFGVYHDYGDHVYELCLDPGYSMDPMSLWLDDIRFQDDHSIWAPDEYNFDIYSYHETYPTEFTPSGDVPWELNNGRLVSGAAGEGQSSCFTAKVRNSAGVVFDLGVDSEAQHDKLNLYVDGGLEGSWSGTVTDIKKGFYYPLGLHEYTWCYEKDTDGITNGTDSAWLDNIKFVDRQPIVSYDFDDDTVAPADFVMSGDATPWTPDGGALKSMESTKNQFTSCTAITVPNSSEIQFDWESGNIEETVYFYVDGIQVASKGFPTTAWSTYTYTTTTGSHEYKWCYEKRTAWTDFTPMVGWIDNVIVY